MKITVICQQCGEILIEENYTKSCKHISKLEVIKMKQYYDKLKGVRKVRKKQTTRKKDV